MQEVYLAIGLYACPPLGTTQFRPNVWGKSLEAVKSHAELLAKESPAMEVMLCQWAPLSGLTNIQAFGKRPQWWLLYSDTEKGKAELTEILFSCDMIAELFLGSDEITTTENKPEF